ncbi:MAG: GNAT family N-acetyltransferase [Treponema sp.]|jgi:phosphinothricin acetyltransferase|nr:GNAT family N-acetyltransferase [Treponema sp.]
MIRPVNTADAPAICGIYNYYIVSTAVSFEENPVSVTEMEGRIRAITAQYPWFVWEEAGEVPAYAYVNTWKERAAYRYAAELSIYVRHGREGRGLGRKMMAHLLEAVRKTDIHTLISGITIPNDRSVALHEKFGFQKIARFREIGFKLDAWQDVGYWELILGEGGREQPREKAAE